MSLFFVIGAMIIYNSLIKSETAIIDEKRGIINSKATLLQDETRTVNQIKVLMEKFEDIAPLEDTLSLSIPDDEDIIGTIRQIESISRVSGVDLISLSFTALPFADARAPFMKRLGTLNIDIRVEGFYQEIKRFLELLETGIRISVVEEFGIRPVRAGENFYSLTVDFNVYYQE